MDQLFATARRVSLHGTTEVSRTVRRVIMRVAALAVLVAAYAPVSAQAATFQFAGAAAYPTDTAPESIATGDLNGDGKVDLVTANGAGNSISVLINNGNGTFAPSAQYPTGEASAGLAVADVNGDGKPDIVVANAAGNTVSVLINKGDGTFEPQVEYPTGKGPSAVALVDLNGDKKPEIVAANEGANTVSVLAGKGDGTFEPQVEYPTGGGPAALAGADVNGDGSQDVVVANTAGNSVSVLLGKGDGTLEAQKEFTTGTAPAGVATADLNGDGKQDIVTADSGSNSVSVLLGKGDGTFSPNKDFTTGSTPRAVALADLNADGKQDIAVANAGANTASVLLGKGDGTFASKQDFGTGVAPVAVVLADLNADGKPDIATANATDNTASVLLNTSVAAVEANPSSLTFPAQLFGTKSAAQKVTVTNNGSAGLTVSSVTVSGKDFSASGCSGSLAPGGTCSVSVTFSPKGYGSLKGEATIATSAGSKVIKLAGTGMPPSPSVTTGAVGEIVGPYVTFTGTVISQGPGTFFFEYGPTTAYGSTTPALPLSSATTPQLLAATVALAPGRTYHYRIVAGNLAATLKGADQAFTIPPEAPLVRVLRHGRLSSVLARGLRLRVYDTSPATITLKLLVDPNTARATHLASGHSKRKVTVGTARVTVSGAKSKTLTVRFTRAARSKLARLGRLKLTISATPFTPNRVGGAPTNVTAGIRR